MIKIKTIDEKSVKVVSIPELTMYLTYKNELRKVTGDEPISYETARYWYSCNLSSECYIIRIYDDYREQIGFVFIACNASCPDIADFYVQDCYLKSEYRLLGVMSYAMEKFIYRHPGRYVLLTLKNYEPAESFWEKVFGLRCGYRKIPVSEIPEGLDFSEANLSLWAP